MLIVALPKSASTALVATLSEQHRLPIETGRIRERLVAQRPLARGFAQIERFHRRELIELDDEVVRAVAAPGLLAKFHFPPTRNNQARLAGVPKLVLLREPEEVVAAYRRGDETRAFPLKSPEFCYCLTERGWQARARETGLLDQLRAFADGWRAHRGDMLLIEYRDLARDALGAIARAEKYLGLPQSGADSLREEKFSRASAAAPRRSALAVLAARRGLILRRSVGDLDRLVNGDTAWSDELFERWRRGRDARRRRDPPASA